jgi:hypothetical protein
VVLPFATPQKFYVFDAFDDTLFCAGEILMDGYDGLRLRPRWIGMAPGLGVVKSAVLERVI